MINVRKVVNLILSFEHRFSVQTTGIWVTFSFLCPELTRFEFFVTAKEYISSNVSFNCCAVGVRKARKIAGSFNLPIIGVHHMEAHALVARYRMPTIYPLENGVHKISLSLLLRGILYL